MMANSEQENTKGKVIDLRDIKKAHENINTYLEENKRWNQIQEKCQQTRKKHRLEFTSPESIGEYSSPNNATTNFDPLIDQSPESHMLLGKDDISEGEGQIKEDFGPIEPKLIVQQRMGMKITCSRCLNTWVYFGRTKFRYYVTCSRCHTSIRLKNQTLGDQK